MKLLFILLLLTSCGTTKLIMKNCEPIKNQPNTYVCEE